MGLGARWAGTVLFALAAFAGCWWGLQAGAGVDAGVAVGVAAVPFTVALTLGGVWAARARTASDVAAGEAEPTVLRPASGHAFSSEHGPVFGPGSDFRGARITVGSSVVSAPEPRLPVEGPVVSAEPRFPGAVPDVWNVPPRNLNFAGRSAELGRIREGLTADGAITVHALRGMGGVGKTQAAIEYAYRYASDYDLVWWVNAERVTAIVDQFVSLAGQLGIQRPAEFEATRRAVHRALRARDRWLLIFDNAESADDIQPLLPGGSGHVLITTRRGGFRALGRVLDLDILDRPEAVALIRRRAPAVTDAQAEQLAAKLGDLPLALDQAAAYIDETSTPPDDYLGLLDQRSADLYRRGHAYAHRDTIATVWSVSIDKLEAVEPAAVQLLGLCAWLAPDPIPLDLFTSHSNLLPEPLATTAADPVAFNETVGALADYSLARRTGGNLVIHRLIQDIGRYPRASQIATGMRDPLQTVLALLRADLPGQIWVTPSNWPRWRALLSSVLSAMSYHTSEADGTDAVWLLCSAGTYLRSQGRYSDALPLHQRALRIHESTLGPMHPDLVTDLEDVGRTLSSMGRAAEALPLHQRALQIRETALGPDHPGVASDLEDIGRALSDLDRAAEALPLYRRALRIRETALGPDHPDIATALNHVGRALLDLDRAAEALPLHQRALQIREAAFGPDHPEVATALNYVGRSLLDLGRPAEALPFNQRALQIHETALGPHHPTVGTALNDVGRTLSDLDRAAEALPLHQRALQIHETALGPHHPFTAQSRAYAAAQAAGRPGDDLAF